MLARMADDGAAAPLEERREFWTDYQPGFRFSGAPVGSPEFFAAVEKHRYDLEPAIHEFAPFRSCDGMRVMEGGCGIATDGVNFARGGADYTGVDFSPTALELAQRRFELEGRQGKFVRASLTDLPLPDSSFDLVYSCGVIHHLPETERAVTEFHRVLKPGGTALVLVYHRNSLNYWFNIMVVRRVLAGLLLVPGAARAVAALTGEQREVLDGHRRLLAEHGTRYLRDTKLFLSNNTDGPDNPLSKVYTAADARRLFASFSSVETHVRFLNLRMYPFGERIGASKIARRLERRLGWHLWIRAVK
jgi:ubiquinone/menaquinone biosynthesis C-methylase UbiE